MSADNTKRFFTNTAFMLEDSIKQANAQGRQYLADLKAAKAARQLAPAEWTIKTESATLRLGSITDFFPQGRTLLDIDLSLLEERMLAAHPELATDPYLSKERT